MLEVFESGDGRFRTGLVEPAQDAFVLVEKTAKGVLLSKFSVDGELLDQDYSKIGGPIEKLKDYLKTEELAVKKVSSYTHVAVNATCDSCGKKSIKREFDLVEPNRILNVPVVPLFVCTSCRKKFYSMNKGYLKKLISNNVDLFEPEEVKNKDISRDEFVEEMKENIIRIFASKKITLIRVEK